MPSISSYPNVYNTCLVLLEKSGFELSYRPDQEIWSAKKNDFEFLADNPIELLGLVAIYEKNPSPGSGEYWWKIDKPDLLSKLDPE